MIIRGAVVQVKRDKIEICHLMDIKQCPYLFQVPMLKYINQLVIILFQRRIIYFATKVLLFTDVDLYIYSLLLCLQFQIILFLLIQYRVNCLLLPLILEFFLLQLGNLMLLIAVLIILAVGCFVAWRFGVFDQFKMQDGRLLACEILYLTYQGEYSKIGAIFEEVNRHCASIFKFSPTFGFYFDNPSEKDPQQCRAVVGIIINEGQQFKIPEFVKKHPNYSQKRLRTTKYLSYEMPYINILSILLMVKKVYPQINDYLKKTDVINMGELSGLMEVYKCARQDKKLEIIVPVENQEQFRSLWGNESSVPQANQEQKSMRRSQKLESELNTRRLSQRSQLQNPKKE